MNKKFASLGTALSREQAKKIMGGFDGGGGGGTDDGDATICTDDSECKTKTRDCSGVQKDFIGKCYYNPGATDKTCHWGNC